MKNGVWIAVLILLICASKPLLAETKSLAELIENATEAEKKDLAKLMHGMTLIPGKDPITGKAVMVVKTVQPGSAFQRQGVQVGDFVVHEHISKNLEDQLATKKY